MKGAEAIAHILKTEGTDIVFNFPLNPILDTCAQAGIRPIMARTERTVVAMADGYTRVLSGKKNGVVVVQDGPGVENTFGGVAQAYSDSTPILVLPGFEGTHRFFQDPAFHAFLNYQHITKWAACINRVDRIPELMRRAFTYLRNGRPGPVLLETAWDLYTAEVDDALIHAYKPVKGVRTMADPEAVREVVAALLAAQHPVIHAGQGVLYAEATEELRQFAELVQVPVMTTMPGKSAFPEDHPLSLGCGRSSREAVYHFLRKADFIFGVGASLSNQNYATPLPTGRVMAQLTVDERDINKDYRVDYPLMGDARLVLRQCLEEARRQLGRPARPANGALVNEIKSVNDAWLQQWMPKLHDSTLPMNPYRVVWELSKFFDHSDVIITHDAGSPRDILLPCWTAAGPHSYIGWGKSTHLGYSLGLAMGAKLAAPHKTVINLMGDGAFGQNGTDFETAARNKIAVLTILLNNGTLALYAQWIPYVCNELHMREFQGDYSMVMKGLGLYAEKVHKPEEMAPALARAQKVLAEGKPAVLEVYTREETALCVKKSY